MIYESLIFLHLSKIHQESIQEKLQTTLTIFFFFYTGKIGKNIEQNQVNSIIIVSVQLHHEEGHMTTVRGILIFTSTKADSTFSGLTYKLHKPKQYRLNF